MAKMGGYAQSTALHVISSGPHDLAYTATVLVRLGTLSGERDGQGRTALEVAAMNGKAGVVNRLILEMTFEPFNMYAFHDAYFEAVRKGHLTVVQLFLDWAMPLDHRRDGERLAEDIAASRGHHDVRAAILGVRELSDMTRSDLCHGAQLLANHVVDGEPGVDDVVSELLWRQRGV